MTKGKSKNRLINQDGVQEVWINHFQKIYPLLHSKRLFYEFSDKNMEKLRKWEIRFHLEEL